MIGGLIIAIALVTLAFFFLNPWLAGVWLLFILAFGLIVYSELRQAEVEEPEPADLLDFDEALRCHGRAPRDKDYEQVGPAIEPHRGKQRIGL